MGIRYSFYVWVLCIYFRHWYWVFILFMRFSFTSFGNLFNLWVIGIYFIDGYYVFFSFMGIGYLFY